MTILPRIDLNDMPATLEAQLAPRIARLGYLGEFFRVGAHQPEALSHFVAFTESLKKALPARTVEIVALTVATLSGNHYERVQHERLALAIGMTKAEVRRILQHDLTTPPFTRAEVLSQDLAAAIVETTGRDAPQILSEVTELAGPEAAVAVVLTAARYLAHAAAANAWELTPPVASPLTDTTEARA